MAYRDEVDFDGKIHDMLWSLGRIEELLMAILALKGVFTAEPVIARLIEDAQRALEGDLALNWMRVDVENVEQQLAIVRRFSGLLMRMHAGTLH